MQSLNDLVRIVVKTFVDSSELFTALDVSNKVKETMPFARHREVRDVVRGLFTSDLETVGWARTPITVTLPDGSGTDALLYHPLSDSWDLDNKYDAQKRAQSAAKATPAPVVPATVDSDGKVTLTPNTNLAAPVVAQVTPAQTQARDLWNNLFNSQPSLFPRR